MGALLIIVHYLRMFVSFLNLYTLTILNVCNMFFRPILFLLVISDVFHHLCVLNNSVALNLLYLIINYLNYYHCILQLFCIVF